MPEFGYRPDTKKGGETILELPPYGVANLPLLF